jgi:mono/diheme cytochrome c family protein
MYWRWLPLLVLCCYQITGPAVQADVTQVERGRYLFRAAGCAACHTDMENKGAFLAGGRKLETPFGNFYSPNITPHNEYGIGRWSDEDFVRALRHGVSPQGKHYFPVFPYTSYTRMRREDMLAIKTYLFSVTPVAQANKPHELVWYARRSLLGIWKWLYFTPGEMQPVADKSEQWQRGRYLVNAMAHCAECHTPRNRLGALQQDMLFAGTKNGPEGETAPNITPHRETGIGGWGEFELQVFLQYGELPDGDYTGGLMAEVVDEGLAHLNKQDIQAMVQYLQTLPAIKHATGE